MRGAWIAAGLLLSSQVAEADQIRVAVASNFSSTAQALAAAFETENEHQVKLVAGSTGKHFTQIKNGAPFEVFLAADAHHPRRLEDENLVIPGTRFTYAVGRLVLWSPRDGLVTSEGRVLESADFRYLAIANPDLAPYGPSSRGGARESWTLAGLATSHGAGREHRPGFFSLWRLVTPSWGLWRCLR